MARDARRWRLRRGVRARIGALPYFRDEKTNRALHARPARAVRSSRFAKVHRRGVDEKVGRPAGWRLRERFVQEHIRKQIGRSRTSDSHERIGPLARDRLPHLLMDKPLQSGKSELME